MHLSPKNAASMSESSESELFTGVTSQKDNLSPILCCKNKLAMSFQLGPFNAHYILLFAGCPAVSSIPVTGIKIYSRTTGLSNPNFGYSGACLSLRLQSDLWILIR